MNFLMPCAPHGSGLPPSPCNGYAPSMASKKPKSKVSEEAPLVGVVMGSKSDWETMGHAVALLEEFGVPCEYRVVSAHRMPDAMATYAKEAEARGLHAIIAGAGGAAGRGRPAPRPCAPRRSASRWSLPPCQRQQPPRRG